jgi:WD40 repeat protein
MKNRLCLMSTTLLVAFTCATISLAQNPQRRNSTEDIKSLASKSNIHVNDILYSPDGTRLAVVGSFGILLYDVGQTGNRIVQAGDRPIKMTGHPGRAWSAAFSPDGKVIASASSHNIRLLDVNTGKLLRTIPENPDSAVFCVAYSPDGKMIASGNRDHTIRLFDADTGERLLILSGHTEVVRCVAFSPDSKMLASGSDDGTFRLWDVVDTGEELHTLTGSQFGLYRVMFSPNGKMLLTTDGPIEKAVRLWNVNTGQLLRKLDMADSRVFIDWSSSVMFSPDGKTIASAHGFGIHLWNPNTGQYLRTLGKRKSSHGIPLVVFSPDGRTIAAYNSGDVKLWDVNTGEYIRTLHKSHLKRP